MHPITTSLRAGLAAALALGALALGTTVGGQAAWAQTRELPSDAPADALEPPIDLSTPLPDASRSDGWARAAGAWDENSWRNDWRNEPWRPYAQPNPVDRFTTARRPSSGWEAKAGVDTGAPVAPFAPEQWTAGVARDASGVASGVAPGVASGIAWAHVTAPGLDDLPLSWDKASVETRLDPAQDQGKLGTSFSRSVPIGKTFSVTLQNGFSLTETLGTGAAASAAPIAGTPAPAGSTATQVFGNSEALRLGILPSDTTLALGAAKSSTDEKWLRSLGAEQKLFGGPFSVSGSVNETANGELSKSIKAGFKHAW